MIGDYQSIFHDPWIGAAWRMSGGEAPLADFDYLQFALGRPLHLRAEQSLYQSMIWLMGPEIRRVPYANTLRRVRPSALLTAKREIRYNRADEIRAVKLRRMKNDPSPQFQNGSRFS